MPLTRLRSQAKLDFPVKKSVRTTKSRVKLTEDLSPRKRASSEDLQSAKERISEKRRKVNLLDNSENLVQTPTKPLTPKRDPLTPRKENIISPSVRLHQLDVKSIGKENSACSSPLRCQGLSPQVSNHCTTPTKNNITKGRSLTFDSPTKGRSLTFDSPTKGSSPSKRVSVQKPNMPLMSPLRLARQDVICYQKVKQVLNTAIPKKLLCREKELAQVNGFLEDHLYKKVPGSLYISGAPGTGKTAVLTQIMDQLQSEKHHLIYINCMSLRNSQAIYNRILSQLSSHRSSLSAKHAQAELEQRLTSKGNMVMLILDEMDQLDSKNQEILYTMFEWPSLQNSRLVLIGIANALDLTDRILPRLLARPSCRPQLLHFTPYNREQIITILQDRLNQVEVDGQSVLEASALKFCASKVAAVTGDIRKALDVCHRAVELVESDMRKQQIINISLCRSPTKRPTAIKKIGVPHILKIINEVYGTANVFQSGKGQTVPLQQKLAICSLLLLVKNGKSKEVPAGKLHEMYSKVCRKQNVACVDQSEFLSMCSLIETRGMVRIKKSKEARSAKISLKLDECELEAALQDKTLISSVLQAGL